MTSPLIAPTPIDSVIRPQPAKPVLPGGELGKDAFLKLLVAQLKYQDPLNPASGSDFIAQTAQFTQVEKLSELAETEGALLAAQQLVGASSLVGRTITWAGTDGVDVSGVVTSAAFAVTGPTVRVGSTDVPLPSIKEVRATPAG